jgi:hypothetical protein
MKAITQPDTSERRRFSVHPGILLSLIRLQGVGLEKALVELIMNSIDADATVVEITTFPEDGRFVVADNGKGFQDRNEIERFFETFGTPHVNGDAFYGRFRVGRGQIMGYANTIWRSGLFEMRVALGGDEPDLGYDLVSHSESYEGCRVEGVLMNQQRLSLYTLRSLVQFMSVPIMLNGKQINTPPQETNWSAEDENAYYRFDRARQSLCVYNLGVLVDEWAVSKFGVAGDVVSKKPLLVNMARNEIYQNECRVWNDIRSSLRWQYSAMLKRARVLSGQEACAFISNMLGEGMVLDGDVKELMRIKFIPNIFGELQTLAEFGAAKAYTVFDGEHRLVAETVHRDKLAFVVLPDSFLGWSRHEGDPDSVLPALIRDLRQISVGDHAEIVEFSVYVTRLRSLESAVPDSDLSADELAVLEALRSVASKQKWAIKDIRAGLSDQLAAWTDGSTFIAIHQRELATVRNEGPAGVISLCYHELQHTTPSSEEHDHDREFYLGFHDAVHHKRFGSSILSFMLHYAQLLCKRQIVPPPFLSAHMIRMAELAPLLRTRSLRRSKSGELRSAAGRADHG